MANKRSIFEDVAGNEKQAVAAVGGVTPPTMESGRRAVVRWLWGLVALIVVMIAVGGLTRLTDSGLSITQWAPIMGAIPPLSATAWDAALDAYRGTAEYQQQNKGMTLAEFKVIFWWEWGHRQLGRFIGLYWAIGFLVFWGRGQLPPARWQAVFWIGPFIGLQGLIGWLMVASGLNGVRLDVAPYWLAAHLGAAFALLAYVLWQAMILGRQDAAILTARRTRERKLFAMGTGLMHFAFLQIVLGGLVAGNDAGLNYTDWPLMNGGVVPPDMWGLDPWWRNVFENDGTVQFIHRLAAYALFGYGLFVGTRAAKSPHKTTRQAFGTVGLLLIVQMIMGVVTVLYAAPWYLASIHQVLAVLLWLMIVRARFAAGYPTVDRLSYT